MSQLTAELVDRLDIEQALSAELEHIPDLLPKQPADLALVEEQEEVGDYFGELTVAGVPIEPAAKVVALKWRHGRRTIATLPLYERVIYRAVVNSLASDLVERVRGKEQFDTFQTAPLEHAGAEYVVMTDLANYYASIDLDRISRELLARTGQWAQVDWLRHFWQVTSDGYGGIPQMNATSDIVADTYAARLHRALLRKGLAVWRYADDFRIACSSYGACVDALEIMDEAAREMGLTLNERKTLTPSISKYRDIVEGPQRRLAAINAEVESELTTFNPYDWSTVTPQEAEIMVESSARILDLWAADPAPEQRAETIDLAPALPLALTVLGVTERTAGLDYVLRLLRFEPQFTPVVARYIGMLPASAADEVRATVAECLNRLTLTKWQHVWLLHALEDVYSGNNNVLQQWMRSQAADTLVPLQCQAVWTLARNYSLALSDWERVDAHGSRYTSGFAIASLPGVRGIDNETKDQLGPTGKMEELIYKWSTSTPFALPF